jgi:hypothetical protein
LKLLIVRIIPKDQNRKAHQEQETDAYGDDTMPPVSRCIKENAQRGYHSDGEVGNGLTEYGLVDLHFLERTKGRGKVTFLSTLIFMKAAMAKTNESPISRSLHSSL